MDRKYQSASLDRLLELHSHASRKEDLNLILHELTHRKTKGAKRLAKAIREQLGHYEVNHSRHPHYSPELAKADGGSSSHSESYANIVATSQKFQKSKRNYALTDEQSNSLDCFKRGGNLKVTAFAGTGKTSTLVAMGRETKKRGLYVAFNKAIAQEAKLEFPRNIDCRTTHSVALRAVSSGHGFSHKKLFDTIGPKQLSDELKFADKAFGNKMMLSSVQQAHMVLSGIKNFCQSGDENITSSHIVESGRLLGLSEPDKNALREFVLHQADTVWQLMKNAESAIPLGHDGYLKLWSLGNPILEYEHIFLDEAQDTSEVVISVLDKQSTQLILVGDSHQQIYEWRGAVDAMRKFNTEKSTQLTQSFRFGEVLASAASRVLQNLNETRRLRGNTGIATKIVESGSAQAILTRTNSTVIEEVLAALENGVKPHIIGGFSEQMQMIKAVYDLKKGIPSVHPEFYGFLNWAEAVDFSESEEGQGIRPFVSLVEQHGVGRIYYALKGSVKEEAHADIVISTAHKAKGRQWESVKIANDFGSVNSESGPIPDEEIRLFYVAITRAKIKLVIPSILLQSYQRGYLSSSM